LYATFIISRVKELGDEFLEKMQEAITAENEGEFSQQISFAGFAGMEIADQLK
jgi:hypothetical protein